MTAALDVVAALCRRTWIKTLRRPVVLTFSLVQPLMWMLLFGFLFQRFQLGRLPAEVGYLDFLAPGVSAMTVLFGSSQCGIGWIRDLQTGFLPRLLNTPASHHPILIGKILGDVLRVLAQAVAVLLLAVLLGARVALPLPELLPAAVALALFAVTLCSISCAIALRTRAQEAMAAFVHVVNMPLLFTSSALVPRQQMPEWLAALARYNPLTLAVDSWRGALLFSEIPPIAGTLVPLAVLAVVTYLIAASQMRGIAELA